MSDQLTRDVFLQMRDCDVRGRWKRSGMLKQMQEIGEEHSAALGFSRARLVQSGMCWVLYRVALFADEEPVLGDPLSMTTWPGPLEGPIFPRYYVWERRGRPIGRAVAAWVLLDIAARRVLRPKMLPGVYTPSSREPVAALPGALDARGLDAVETRRVRYTDLDANGHMNNARYADWVQDLLEDQAVSTLQINYTNEARLGETIILKRGRGLIAGAREDGRAVFEAKYL